MTTHIIDVRNRDEFVREHIPGSRNIPLEDITASFDDLLEQVWQNPNVVLTCRTGRRAREAARILKAKGCGDIPVMEGGIVAWKKRGGQVRSDKGGISVMRQVQLVIGTMILLGFFVEPLWFLVPFAGFGLIFAALSGTCAMMSVLEKLPWNRLDKPAACSVE